jgi:hypothetical protein
MLAFAPYPHLFDDRTSHYACAFTTIATAFITAFPVLVHRRFLWWSVLILVMTCAVGLTTIFLYTISSLAVWTITALLFAAGSICAAATKWPLRSLSRHASHITRSAVGRGVLALVILLELFLLIPAASGACFAVAAFPQQPTYLMLYMKDQLSPLHEEVVELVVSTTDYLVVTLSDKVPHPKQGFGPTTLPEDDKPGEIHGGPVYFPMLLRRESVEIIVPSVDPEVMIEPFRKKFAELPLTTQPVFRTGRYPNGGVKVWTEFPATSTRPSNPGVGD